MLPSAAAAVPEEVREASRVTCNASVVHQADRMLRDGQSIKWSEDRVGEYLRYSIERYWGRIQRGKKRLKNRLRIRLRLNFDSMTCLNYLFLDFFQYRKSQADSQADSQAVFQSDFPPSGSDPSNVQRGRFFLCSIAYQGCVNFPRGMQPKALFRGTLAISQVFELTMAEKSSDTLYTLSLTPFP